jgi:hypothetical protein
VPQEQLTYLPEEQAVRAKPKFGHKADYEENMDTSMPHTTRVARILHTQIGERCRYFTMQENVRPPLIFHRDAYLTRIIVKHRTTQNFTVHQEGIKKEERHGHGTVLICVGSYPNICCNTVLKKERVTKLSLKSRRSRKES